MKSSVNRITGLFSDFRCSSELASDTSNFQRVNLSKLFDEVVSDIVA
jgi:hypothetical protein